MKCILDADIQQILAAIPKNSVIQCVDAGYDGKVHPKRIRKVRDGIWVDADRGKEYPIAMILDDVANRRISLGNLLTLAEQDQGFEIKIGEEDGKILAYNARLSDLEEGRKKQEQKLTSESLLIFRETMPKILVDAGMADSPTKITKFVCDKVCARMKNDKRNAHGYNIKTLMEIGEALDKPLAIIRSKTKSGDAALVVITEVPDRYDHLSVVVMAQDGGREDNWISSIYGKDKLASYLKNQQEAGNLLWITDNRQRRDILLDHAGSKWRPVMEKVLREHKNPKKGLSDVRNLVQMRKPDR